MVRREPSAGGSAEALQDGTLKDADGSCQRADWGKKKKKKKGGKKQSGSMGLGQQSTHAVCVLVLVFCFFLVGGAVPWGIIKNDFDVAIAVPRRR